MHAMKWTQERYPYYNFLQKSTSHWCKTWFRNVKRVSFIYYHDNMLLLVHQYIFPKEFPSVNSQPRSRSMVKVKNLQKENVFFIQLWAQWHTFPYTLHIIQSIHPLHGQWPDPVSSWLVLVLRNQLTLTLLDEGFRCSCMHNKHWYLWLLPGLQKPHRVIFLLKNDTWWQKYQLIFWKTWPHFIFSTRTTLFENELEILSLVNFRLWAKMSLCGFRTAPLKSRKLCFRKRRTGLTS